MGSQEGITFARLYKLGMKRMKSHCIWAICFLTMLSVTSCQWIDPDEPTPAFIQLEDYLFDGGVAFGSNNEKISEVWIFANGETIGAYDAPATIPVLQEGAVEVSFRAGIKNNGISNDRKLYPFYTPYDVVLDLVPGETVTVSPEFTYIDNITVASHEDFESAGIVYESAPSSQVSMEPTSLDDEVFEGQESGRVLIPGDFTYWEGVTIDKFDLPGGETIYMELNYKSNNNFAVGIYAVASDDSEEKHLSLIINDTNDENGVAQWNKIYVELTDVVAANLAATNYRVYIESNKQSDVSEVQLFLDNLRVIHFD